MNTAFAHEKLKVYRGSLEFVAWAAHIVENVPQRLSVRDQIERASASVPLNIAQGNSRATAPDRCRFIDTARGSALECAACLDVLVVRKLGERKDYLPGKQKWQRSSRCSLGWFEARHPTASMRITANIEFRRNLQRARLDLCIASSITKDSKRIKAVFTSSPGRSSYSSGFRTLPPTGPRWTEPPRAFP